MLIAAHLYVLSVWSAAVESVEPTEKVTFSENAIDLCMNAALVDKTIIIVVQR